MWSLQQDHSLQLLNTDCPSRVEVFFSPLGHSRFSILNHFYLKEHNIVFFYMLHGIGKSKWYLLRIEIDFLFNVINELTVFVYNIHLL